MLEDHLWEAGSIIARLMTNPSKELKERCESTNLYEAILELGEILSNSEKITQLKYIEKSNPRNVPLRVPPLRVKDIIRSPRVLEPTLEAKLAQLKCQRQ